MLDRGLVTIGTNPMGRPAAFFTETGLQGLRQLLQDRRVMDAERFDHLRLKLGVDDPPAGEGGQAFTAPGRYRPCSSE